MDSKSLLAVVVIFILLILGMVVYVFVKQQELSFIT